MIVLLYVTVRENLEKNYQLQLFVKYDHFEIAAEGHLENSKLIIIIMLLLFLCH